MSVLYNYIEHSFSVNFVYLYLFYSITTLISWIFDLKCILVQTHYKLYCTINYCILQWNQLSSHFNISLLKNDRKKFVVIIRKVTFLLIILPLNIPEFSSFYVQY